MFSVQRGTGAKWTRGGLGRGPRAPSPFASGLARVTRIGCERGPWGESWPGAGAQVSPSCPGVPLRLRPGVRWEAAPGQRRLLLLDPGRPAGACCLRRSRLRSPDPTPLFPTHLPVLGLRAQHHRQKKLSAEARVAWSPRGGEGSREAAALRGTRPGARGTRRAGGGSRLGQRAGHKGLWRRRLRSSPVAQVLRPRPRGHCGDSPRPRVGGVGGRRRAERAPRPATEPPRGGRLPAPDPAGRKTERGGPLPGAGRGAWVGPERPPRPALTACLAGLSASFCPSAGPSVGRYRARGRSRYGRGPPRPRSRSRGGGRGGGSRVLRGGTTWRPSGPQRPALHRASVSLPAPQEDVGGCAGRGGARGRGDPTLVLGRLALVAAVSLRNPTLLLPGVGGTGWGTLSADHAF